MAIESSSQLARIPQGDPRIEARRPAQNQESDPRFKKQSDEAPKAFLVDEERGQNVDVEA